MKGLFLFIKNNRIIYKISIVSILILMFISVVQINPDDMNTNKQDGFPTATQELNYTLVYNNGDFYKTSVAESNKISTSEYPIGLSIKKVSQVEQEYSISINRELMGGVEDVIVMNGVDIATNLRWTTLSLEGDVYIYLKGNNKITSKYGDTGTIKWYSGINSKGNISFIGDGSLNVTYSDESSGINRHTAIQSSKNIYIQGVNIFTKGSYYGICAEDTVRIDSGKVKAVAINCNYDTTGIRGKNSVEINGGEVSVASNSSNTWAGGISTGKNGEGDSIKITGGKVDISVSNPNPNSISMGLDSGKITLSGGETNININGNKCTGIGAIGSTSGNGLYISDNAKISVDGNVTGASYGINSSSNMLDIKGGNISIKLRNAINDNKVIGIRLYSSIMSMSSGNLDVSVDVYRENDKQYGIADGIYAINSSSNMEVSGGNLRVKTNGRSLSTGVNVGGNVTISGGSIEARNTNKTEQGYGINVSGTLSIQGGYLTAQGNSRAVNLQGIESISMGSSVEKGYSVSVIAASTDFDGKTLEDYDNNQLSSYKYIEIGKVYNYSLKYNASSGTLHKVSTDSELLTDANKIDSSDLPGWEIVNEAGKNVLVLKGLDFVTSKTNGLMIVCNDDGNSSIRLQEGISNRIGVVSQSNSPIFGITCDKSLEIRGSGELDITVNANEGSGIFLPSDEGTLELDSTRIIFRERTKNYGCGINMSGAINIKNSIVEMDIVSNGMGQGISTGVLGTSNTGEIKIYKSNIKLDINTVNGGITGINTKGNISFSDNSYIDLNYNSGGENNCTGLNGDGLTIDKSSLNMIIDNDNDSVSGMNFKTMNIDGGDSYISVKGAKYGQGINCSTSYTQKGGRVVIDSGDIRGIYTSSGSINVDDGTLEITSANIVMSKAPTITDANVSISEYILQSDSTKTLKYTGANVTNIPSYSHVIIEPNYFYKYASGKLYKCQHTDDVNRDVTDTDMPTGMYIDTANNTITLDGFVFTTSKRMGLYTKENIKINLADNSKNIISTKLDIANAGNAICDSESTDNYLEASINCSGSALTLEGNGYLYLSGNVIAKETTSRLSYCIGIKAKTFTMNGGNLNIKCNALDVYNKYQAKSIFCDDNITINGGNIDAYAFGAKARGLSADNTITISSNYTGNINSICKGTDIHNISGDEGVSILGGNITIKNELGEDNIIDPDAYGIYSNNDNANDNIDKITIGTQDSDNKVNIVINNNHRGNSRGIYAYGDLSIYNSEIDFISNSDPGTKEEYGLYSKQNDLTIEDSSINVTMINNNGNEITGLCGRKNATIKNSDVVIDISSEECVGIIAELNDISIEKSIIDIKAISRLNKVVGIISSTANVNVNNSDMDMNIEVAQNDTEVMGISAKELLVVNNNNIVINAKANQTTAFDDVAGEYATQQYLLYSEATDKAIEINNSYVKSETLFTNGYVIYAKNGNVVSNNSVLDIDIKDDGSISNIKSTGIYAKELISIINSNIDIISNLLGRTVGIVSYEGNVEIYKSTINIESIKGEVIGIFIGDMGTATTMIKVIDSYVKTIINNGEGIYSCDNLDIENSTVIVNTSEDASGTIYGIDDALSHHGGIRPIITSSKEVYEDLVL